MEALAQYELGPSLALEVAFWGNCGFDVMSAPKWH